MGVSINETWSYQIYNYTGIGYYPATAPQPWPPPLPKTQSQPVGGAALAGTGLPAAAPTRNDADTADWSKVPQWVIYPVSTQVTKSDVLHQSTETFAEKTVSLTAGARPGPQGDTNFDPHQPYRTYPTDVPSWLSLTNQTSTSYTD